MNNSLDNLSTFAREGLETLVGFLPSVVAALVILILGLWLVKFITKKVRKVMTKRELEPGLIGFVTAILSVALKVILFIIVIAKLGVETTSFAAVLAAAGLAIGLALQGSLSNFAGGVLIILLKPFKVGDFIEAQGVSGTVTEITIFYTYLTTFGNQRVVIPNGELSNNKVTNYSILPLRRNNLAIGISYDSDIKKTREVLLSIVNNDERTLKDPEPVVVVTGLGDNSVDLSLRFWAKNEDYWGLHFDTIEKLKVDLEAAGVSFPFPQRDVHLYNMDKK